MSDLFAAFVRRAHGATAVQPVVPGRFEPPGLETAVWGEIDSTTVAQRDGRRDIPTARGPRERPSDEGAAPPADAPGPRVAPVHDVVVASEPLRPRPLAPSEVPAGDQAAPAGRPAAIDIAAIVEAALRASAGHVRPAPSPAVSGQGEAPCDAPVAGLPRDTMSAAPAVDSPAPPPLPVPLPVDLPAPAPTIEVRIGRIEVTAPPAPARPAASPRPPRPAAGLTLSEYLAQRGRR